MPFSRLVRCSGQERDGVAAGLGGEQVGEVGEERAVLEPAGFRCSIAFDPSTKQSAIACPSGKAAANQALEGTVKLSKALFSGGATLFEAGAKLVGPFPITGP